ncbi:hypothetical protein [Bacillus sp. FDAARGOS_1420]|uniref:hypothetical protein n=1 Tax=unclassified Bacillus (in: firmicutes) TaxID=185979 RepID=UPI001C5AD07C|nr:hypothetical protein [Bacillus sp. FDAARGOS_1420]MBW3496616.1 hypothetical protein [Bacillus sp. FDAARGOS_1420]
MKRLSENKKVVVAEEDLQLTELLEVPQSTVSQYLSKKRGKILCSERRGHLSKGCC